ncbi:response regulator transcription factor [Cohnella lupini]|jgi:two-component system response regulator YesN|uniref:AraC family two component transcriptional regulator n=1 Tax=Cohnella lupini TaxID=1294267 RepID=A0A3D9IJD9_9BACL|nr:AraC family transcriptional regulator [Cohnella lupini]RED61880.1 AraC family two component transcriptional regulator [Cohnella lupini]
MNPIHFIVAEDEPLLLRTLVNQIQRVDPLFHIVHAAHDGESVLRFIENSQVPDVLITDIHMPVMDGIRLIGVIEKYYPSVKKVIISGFSEFEYARQALKNNVLDFLLKPVKKQDLEDLLSKIQIMIESERTDLKSPMLLKNRQYTSEEIVKTVAQFIKTNYSKELSLEDIAKQFNVNAPHLSKIFLKYAGESPSKYIMSLRMNEAKQLLSLKKELSVKEVGEAVGYPDPFYFSRIFKQHTSMTPTEYRNRLE